MEQVVFGMEVAPGTPAASKAASKQDLEKIHNEFPV